MNELARKIHENAKKKGFYDKPREVGTLLMLVVSELSEALEADRLNKRANMGKYHQGIAYGNVFEAYVKDTFEDELADSIIRILDLCGYLNIDIENHIKAKMRYNELRENKHGKEY